MSTFGFKLRNYLAAAKAAAKPGSWNGDEWVRLVDLFVEVERPLKSPKPKSVAKMTDEEWLASLEAEPSLAGVDVKRELGKAQFWVKQNEKRRFTRKFFLNWLSKAERTLTLPPADGKSSFARAKPDIYQEPDGWQFVADKLFPQTDYFRGRKWLDVNPVYRTKILQELL